MTTDRAKVSPNSAPGTRVDRAERANMQVSAIPWDLDSFTPTVGSPNRSVYVGDDPAYREVNPYEEAR